MTTIFNGLPHNPYANQGNSDKPVVGHESTQVIQQTGASSEKPKIDQPGDRYEHEADQVSASITSLPDTQTIGSDIQAIDGQFIDPSNAQTAAPLLQFLTTEGSQPRGLVLPEASRNELPPEINSNPNPGKDPMLELIEGMKASLRQIGN